MKSAKEILLELIFKRKSKKLSLLLATLCTVYCVIMFMWADSVISTFDVTDHKVTRRKIEEGLKRMMKTDKGTGCVMPKLDVFDPKMMAFEWKIQPIDCKMKNWVVCKKDRCQLDPGIKQTHINVYCKYQDITFFADEYIEIGEPTILSENEVYALHLSDFVLVSCGGTDANGKWSEWIGHVAGLRPLHRNITSKSGQSGSYSMLVFAFDSASRNGFVRKMPRSYAALTEDLGAILMNGYNIVGDGTANAVIPMLTGYNQYELPEIRKGSVFRQLHNVDSYPLIWYSLEKNGYKTGYLEDSPELRNFTHRFTGFVKQPTDLYGRALVLGSKLDGDREYCISGLPIHKVFMDLTEQFMDDDSRHRFIFTYSGLPHKHHNMLRAADDDFAFWLQRLKERGLLKDTVLFVMGDHGPSSSEQYIWSCRISLADFYRDFACVDETLS